MDESRSGDRKAALAEDEIIDNPAQVYRFSKGTGNESGDPLTARAFHLEHLQPSARPIHRKVILPLTVLRRFDCLLAPTKERVLKEQAQIKAKPESVVRSLLEKITGRPFYNLSRLDLPKLLDDQRILQERAGDHGAFFLWSADRPHGGKEPAL